MIQCQDIDFSLGKITNHTKVDLQQLAGWTNLSSLAVPSRRLTACLISSVCLLFPGFWPVWVFLIFRMLWCRGTSDKNPALWRILAIAVHTHITINCEWDLKQKSWWPWSCPKGTAEAKWDLPPRDCRCLQRGSLFPCAPPIASWMSHFSLCCSFFSQPLHSKRKDHPSKWIALFTNSRMICHSFHRYGESASYARLW